MNRILIFALIMLCSASVYGQKKKRILRNKIKTIIVYEQKGTAQAQKESETSYNTQGKISEEIDYDEGKVQDHIKYEYDEEGNLVKETHLDASGKTVKTIQFSYNASGQAIKEIETNSSGKTFKTIEYKYDGELKSEKDVYDGNNKLKSKKT